MSSQWEVQLSALKAEIENKMKQISLLEQLIALEEKHAGGSAAPEAKENHSAEIHMESNNHHASKPQRKRSASRRQQDGEKEMRLPELLQTIGQQHAGEKIPYKTLAEEVVQAGYKSNSSNFNNMVYQSLQKLVKRGVYTKDAETREYQFVGK